MTTTAEEHAAYDDHARARWAPEERKRAGRTPFERDRARVVHSSALRRLGAKTQVHGPGTDDFVRTRLTHSLEVAQVGRELGRALGCDPDVVETACLAHDLGHPPFGHNGERALDEAAAACGGFEGNAQTLRLLTRLEAKAFRDDGRSAGLNLTRASLDASTKYPWQRPDAPAHRCGVPRGPDRHADGSPALSPKFGAYDDDAGVFAWLRVGAPGQRRCVEAQVMDWADDVAYSVHDVEDGVQSGAIVVGLVHDRGTWDELFEVVRGSYAPGVEDDELAETLVRLLALPEVPTSFDGSLRGLAALKTMTSALVGRFTTAVEVATRAARGPGRLTRYAADLTLPRAATLEVAVLKGLAAHWVMRTEARVPVLLAQRHLVRALVDLLLERSPDVLEPPFRADWAAAQDDAGRFRVVVDQTASLTDGSAVAWHTHLDG